MSKYLKRDPFARTELRRDIVPNADHTFECSWCGMKPKTLYAYATEHDGGRLHKHKGKFCNFTCFDMFNT